MYGVFVSVGVDRRPGIFHGRPTASYCAVAPVLEVCGLKRSLSPLFSLIEEGEGEEGFYHTAI